MMRVARLLVRRRLAYWLVAALLSVAAGWLAVSQFRLHLNKQLRSDLAAWSDREGLVLKGLTEDSLAMGAVRLAGRVNPVMKKVVTVTDVNIARRERPGADVLAVLTDHIGAELSFIVNGDGVVVADWNRGIQATPIGQIVRGRQYYRQAMLGKPNVFMGLSVTASRRSIYLSAPIYPTSDLNSRPIGVLSARYLAERLDDFLGARRDVTGLLISPHGVVMASSRRDWIMALVGPATAERSRLLTATQQYGRSLEDPDRATLLPFDPSQETVTLRGHSHLVISKEVDWSDPAGPWRLVYMTDQELALSRPEQAILGGLTALVTFALLGVLWRQMAVRVVRSQRERELAAQEQRYLHLIEQTPVGIGVIADHQVLVANTALRRLVDVHVGQPWPETYADPDSRARADAMLSADASGGDTALSLVAPDGQTRSCHAVFVPVEFHRCGTLVWLTDLTEELAAEAEIRRAQDAAENATRMRADFLANMSHELRTPMNAIIGMSDLALQTDLDARQRNYVGKARDAADNLLSVIDDILDFSRIEAGRMTLERIPFDLHDVLDHTARVLGLGLEQKRVELLVSVPADVPTALIGDPLRLGQVLTQLGKRAARVTEHGAVVIAVNLAEPIRTSIDAIYATDATDGADGADASEAAADQAVRDVWVRLQFSIQDSGPGMTPIALAQLRRRLEDCDPAAPHVGDLGLAVCRQLLALMGGRMWLESMPHVGCTFHFCVPLALQDPDACDDGMPPARPAGARVLIADDSRVARELLAGLCRDQGLTADLASGGRQALRMAHAAAQAQRPYAWALLDWRMPDMDGLTVAARMIDALDPLPRLVLVTAFSSEESLYEKLSSLPDGWRPPVLAKPVTVAALSATLGARATHGEISARARRRDERDAAIRSLAGARLLVVDDIAVNRDLAEALLAGAGISVTTAHNGLVALDLMRESPHAFDGVLMDCQMPEMDGYETTRRLREDPQWRTLPVIALTANATVADRARILAAGMNDHIAKPLNADALFETLARWIRPRHPTPDGARAADADAEALAPTLAVDTSLGGTDFGAFVPAGLDTHSPMPDVEGLEAGAGLAIAANNVSLYLRLLRVFHQSQQTTSERLAQAATEEDPDALARLAHGLRGSAGTIGAIALSETAARLEEACHAGAPAAQRQALAVDVAAALDRLLRGLDGPLATLPPSPMPSVQALVFAGAPSPSDEARGAAPIVSASRLQLLHRQLRDHDGAAIETAEALLAELGAAVQGDDAGRTRLRQALTAAVNVDFDTASRLLEPQAGGAPRPPAG